MLSFNISDINEVGSPLSVDHTLTVSNVRDGYLRFNTATSDGNLLIPSDVAEPQIKSGDVVLIRNAGEFDLQIEGNESPSVVLNFGTMPVSAVILPKGKNATLIKVDDNEWDTIGDTLALPVVVPDFTAEAVYFDGTDYLSRTSLNGQANGKTLSVSFWVRLSDIPSSGSQVIFNINSIGDFPGGANAFTITMPWNGMSGLRVLATSPSPDAAVDLQSSISLSADTWYHVLISSNRNTNEAHMFINGTDQMNKVVHNGEDYDMTPTSGWYIAGINGGTLPGDLSEFWFTDEYIDFSIEDNRNKFVSALNAPADLGANGALPTGNAPLIYMKGDAANWNAGINAGSGGDFTMTGSVTDSVNEPVEV